MHSDFLEVREIIRQYRNLPYFDLFSIDLGIDCVQQYGHQNYDRDDYLDDMENIINFCGMMAKQAIIINKNFYQFRKYVILARELAKLCNMLGADNDISAYNIDKQLLAKCRQGDKHVFSNSALSEPCWATFQEALSYGRNQRRCSN